jgi:hypothetical protein
MSGLEDTRTCAGLDWTHPSFVRKPSYTQIKQFLNPLLKAVAKPYAANVNKTLAGYGLRYDDLYDPLKVQ